MEGDGQEGKGREVRDKKSAPYSQILVTPLSVL
jgi:hypothetical protein